MADRAVNPRNHNLASGTGTTVVDGVKGSAKNTWRGGKWTAIAGAIGLGALGFWATGGLSAIPYVGGVLHFGLTAFAAIAGFAGGAVAGGLGGAVFGGINGLFKGSDRVHAEQQAHNLVKAQQYGVEAQMQQAAVTEKAINNLHMLQAMEQQMLQANPQVMGAADVPGTTLEPSAHMKANNPALAEAANDNAELEDMLKTLKDASHADKVLADKANAAEAETAR